ncbi:MAG: hypothetical protein KGL46_09815 [Hyphomicrobiales bacterium]|nr:hypothetical protein [Hyphomicrobiales bacterium]
MNFDTLELANALEKSGLNRDAAEAIVKAVLKAQENFVTRDELSKNIAESIRTQTVWMTGIVFAAIAAVAAMVHFAK